MEFLKSKSGRFIIGGLVAAGIAVYNSSDFAQRHQVYFDALKLGSSVSFEAPKAGERLAVVLETTSAQDLRYTIKGPGGETVYENADTVKTRHRGFFFRVKQSGTHTLHAAYDCTDCSPGTGYATADIHKAPSS